MKQFAEKQAGYEISYVPRARAGTEQLAGLVTGLSRVLDKIAGLCMVAIMLLVISNIILRAFLNRPILGTYEYVGFLTAVVIGLALAYCAVQNGHIAISFVADRFPPRIQAAVDMIMNAAALCFWGLSAWYIWKYGRSMTDSGVVAPTTQIPFYPFVYLVSFGLFVLSLVLFVRLIESIKRTAVNR